MSVHSENVRFERSLAAMQEQRRTVDAAAWWFDERAVWQSWQRCRAAGLEPGTPIRLRRAAARSALDAARRQVMASAVERLATSLGRAPGVVMVTDAAGTIVHAAGGDAALPGVWRDLLRPGTSLAEPAVGTSAPTLAMIERRAQTVVREAHYCRSMGPLCCNAVPLADPSGGLIGALDISGYEDLSCLNAASLLELAAARIEDEVLRLQATAGVMRLLPAVADETATRPALVAVDTAGQVCALNGVARGWLGAQRAPRLPVPLTWLLGSQVGHIERSPKRHPGSPVELQLPQGWLMRMWYEAPDRRSDLAPMAPAAADPMPAPARPEAPEQTLAQTRRAIVRQALAACDGNVSRAAERLRVSRSSIYRWLAGAHGAARADGDCTAVRQTEGFP